MMSGAWGGMPIPIVFDSFPGDDVTGQMCTATPCTAPPSTAPDHLVSLKLSNIPDDTGVQNVGYLSGFSSNCRSAVRPAKTSSRRGSSAVPGGMPANGSISFKALSSYRPR